MAERGITLIALVITIIVILILAGVTIATLTGDNGLLQKATTAKQANEEATALEKIKVEVAGSYGLDGKIDVENQLNKNLKKINGLTLNSSSLSDTNKITKLPVIVKLSGYSFTISEEGKVEREKTIEDYPEIAVDVLATENSRYISDNKTAVIPKGYRISNKSTEQSIDYGLVVKDSNENEWVWIPVSSTDLAAMYTEDSGGWTMSGTSGENAVVTKYKTAGIGTPGVSTDRREPDVLDNATYDRNTVNLETAGFNSYINMAEVLRDDYKNMINSINKYGGFYIGRFELGKNGNSAQVKEGTVMNNVNWYKLYSECKKFGNSSVESRMIWSCQWNQVCKFINEYGDKVPLNNSNSYGNYETSTGDAATNSGKSKFNETTGRNQAWKTNNIYDLAGNCYEFTQEVAYMHNTLGRVLRGLNNYGKYGPVTSVDIATSLDTGINLSSRPILYIK